MRATGAFINAKREHFLFGDHQSDGLRHAGRGDNTNKSRNHWYILMRLVKENISINPQTKADLLISRLKRPSHTSSS